MSEPSSAGISKKYQVSNAIHSAAVSLLQTISDCFDIESLVYESPRLFIDAAHVLWKFVEPLIRDIGPNTDPSEFKILKLEESILMILRCIHIIVSEFPFEDVMFGVSVSNKLAEILEGIGELSEASDTLTKTAAKMTQTRTLMGEGQQGIASITCTIGLYRSFIESRKNKLEEIYPNFETNNNLFKDLYAIQFFKNLCI
jgi:hypothetical protein